MENRGSKTKHSPVLLAKAPARQGDASAAQHAPTSQQHAESNQAPAGRSGSAVARRAGGVDQSLLQMQRQTGNRSVQRALGLAPRRRQGQDVPAPVARRIQLERGGGQMLDRNVRLQMERALGTDFRGVRVHTGAEADVLNRKLHARAFTTGRDIFFRQGAYNPESSAGRELIAHELTHVLHQGNQEAGPSQRKMAVNQPGDRFEQEANRVAQATIRQEQQHGRPVAGGPAVQRQAEDEKKKAVQTQAEEDKDKAVQAKAEEDDKVQTQPEEDKDKAVQTKAEEDEKVQTQPEEDKDKAVQAKAEEEDKVQTQAEEDKDKAVQAKAEEEDKVQTQAEEDKDKAVQAKAEEEKDKAST